MANVFYAYPARTFVKYLMLGLVRASKGIRKSPGAFLGTFRDLSFITSSRRLGLRLGQFYERGEFVRWNDSKSDGIVNRIFVFPWGTNFKLKIVRQTTTYWGWLRPIRVCYNVPNPKPPKVPELLHEWF